MVGVELLHFLDHIEPISIRLNEFSLADDVIEQVLHGVGVLFQRGVEISPLLFTVLLTKGI